MRAHVADGLASIVGFERSVGWMRVAAFAPLAGFEFFVAGNAEGVIAGGKHQELVGLGSVCAVAALANEFQAFWSGLGAGGDEIGGSRYRHRADRMAAVCGAGGLLAVAELAELALIVAHAKEERAGHVLGAGDVVSGVAGAARELAVFQRQSRRNLHRGGRGDAGLVALLLPHFLAQIANRTVVAAEAGRFPRSHGDLRLVHEQHRAGLVEIGVPFEVADRAIAAGFGDVLQRRLHRAWAARPIRMSRAKLVSCSFITDHLPRALILRTSTRLARARQRRVVRQCQTAFPWDDPIATAGRPRR